MSLIRIRRPGSLFKHYFAQITLSVIACLLVASFSLLFFFVNIWENDRMMRLSDNALSLGRSVSVLYREDREILSLKTDNAPVLASALVTAAEQASCAVFLLSADGRVLLCQENVQVEGGAYSIRDNCSVHRDMVFDASLLEEGKQASGQPFSSQAKILPGDPTDYFYAILAIGDGKTPLGYALAIQSVTDAYLPYTTQFVRLLIFTGLMAVFLAFLFSLICSYAMVKPMKKLTDATKEYAGGNFSRRVPETEQYSELAELAASFNRMAESLAEIDASRSMFVSNVSHELKTPMTIISGFIDGILDGTIPPEDERKYLTIVSDETKRLSRLVVAMLNISKIEAGKLTLNLSDVPLADLLCNTLLGFEQEIEKKQITVTGLDTLEPLTVPADEVLLNQIFYNLVDNAVKFTPEGGEITVSLRAEKKYATARIRNTGKGIPKDECNLVFDRFYKVDKSRGLDAKSFGMGLFIVKSIVDLHHGSITVESEENLYTEFTVRLPMQ